MSLKTESGGENVDHEAEWAGAPVHDHSFTAKYGKSRTSFGLSGRIFITIITVYIGIWFIVTISSGGTGSMLQLLVPGAAIYIVVILPVILKDVWKKNRLGSK